MPSTPSTQGGLSLGSQLLSKRPDDPSGTAVKEHLPELVREPYSLDVDQVVVNSFNQGGGEVLALLKEHGLDLVNEPYNRTREDLVGTASCQRGKKQL